MVTLPTSHQQVLHATRVQAWTRGEFTGLWICPIGRLLLPLTLGIRDEKGLWS